MLSTLLKLLESITIQYFFVKKRRLTLGVITLKLDIHVTKVCIYLMKSRLSKKLRLHIGIASAIVLNSPFRLPLRLKL